MAHKKLNLPEKMFQQCKRPFAWRKKWLRCWEEVKYCSDACRRKSKQKNQSVTPNLCQAGQVEDEF